MKNPFEKCLPSTFVVATPFQALCAVAAIKNLQISDFVIVAVFHGGIRDSQLVKFLEKKGINYIPFRYTHKCLFCQYIKALFGFSGKYERLFCGFFGSSYMQGVGLPFVKTGSPIVYLDDGNNVVSFLMNTYKLWDASYKRMIMNVLAIRKKTHPLQNLYTMYSDIENPIYRIGYNDITSVWKVDNAKREIKNIVIIGTTIGGYCSQMRMPESLFIEELGELFKSIREEFGKTEDRIIYIPHGGDRSVYAEELCGDFGFEFIRANTMVEEYLIEEKWTPKIVIGFCSTTLLNIRRIMPSVEVRNIFVHMNIKNPYQEKYLSIVEYYKKNGIPCKEIVVEGHDSN